MPQGPLAHCISFAKAGADSGVRFDVLVDIVAHPRFHLGVLEPQTSTNQRSWDREGRQFNSRSSPFHWLLSVRETGGDEANQVSDRRIFHRFSQLDSWPLLPRVVSIACLAWFLTLAIAASFVRQAFAVDWQPHTHYRAAALTPPASGKTGFTEMAPAVTGILFTNLLAESRSLTNQIFLNGSGVAAGDVDGDGLCDLYFCGLDSPNVLYRNLGGWRFENVTATAGVAFASQPSTGAAFADVDGDGDLDLLLNGVGSGTRLLLNNGRGQFRDVTAESGLHGTAGSASMALADVDGDGFLDLYIVNYRNDTMRDMPDIRFRLGVTNGLSQLLSVNGRPATDPELAGRFSFDRASGVLENGQADTLFHNDGRGHFTALSWTNGTFLDEVGMPISTPYDWGLSAMFRDMNGDGAPDLYVCNDFQSPDRMWINDGHGKFRAAAPEAIRQTSLFSMGVDFADIDRDGHDDFFVADMLSREHVRRQVQVMDATAFAQVRGSQDSRPQFSRNTLFLNRGDNTYAELAQLSGIEASDWSWCPAFLDVDLDGFEDLLVTTGHWRDAQHADVARELDDEKRRRSLSPLEQLRARRRFPRLDTPNAAFRNRGDLTFDEQGPEWGFDSRRISHGMALADLDNDGDLDVIINCLNAPPLLLRNDSSRPRVSVRLRGLAPNTRGVGAKIRVVAPGLPAQSQEMVCAGRYLSSDDFVRTFAAGTATNLLTLSVTWRNGRESLLTNVLANHVYEIDESATATARTQSTSLTPPGQKPHDLLFSSRIPVPPKPFFQDLSQRLNHEHVDEPFDDFALQPLLLRKLSELGPGVTWFDFNGDGWDDLFVGTGRGGRLAVFRNDAQGGFVRQRAKLFEVPSDTDLTSVLAWRPNPTNSLLLMGLANDQSAVTNAPAVRQFSLVTGEVLGNLLRAPSSTGPLALADFDGDGDLDLFVGGRMVPGRYPEAASSALLRNERGALRFDEEASRMFVGIGLVSGALFTDLDGDGWPELVLACDWGPIRILRNEHGRFTAWDPPLTRKDGMPPNPGFATLNALSGWWTSIAAGDFDNDGRLDLIAGNWGRNNARQRFLSESIRAYFGDPDGSGHLAILEAHRDPGLGQWMPTRDLSALGAVFPTLRERFTNFTAFSTATIPQVLAAGLPSMREVSITTSDSMLLLNRGDHFAAQPLPIEAQFSPAFGLAIGDLDGDGNEDVFLAQNVFSVSSAESRQDAGVGLWLRGDGNGRLTAVPASESGIAVFGEGRGTAVCDFDHDGRLDLVVAQNRGLTKLYHNERARPGLRVHLTGTADNPQAVGARLRLLFRGGGSGPVSELRIGGGYWSQDSLDLVLGTARDPEALEIRWPGGIVERVPLSSKTGLISRSIPVN